MCATYHLVSNASRDFLKKVFFIAGEASGDIYGGLIAHEMSSCRLSNIGRIEMRGWGGNKMTDAGVEVTSITVSWRIWGFGKWPLIWALF